ncbi:acetyl-CoA carboxylase biotin carboxyl carrier protein [Butyricicoccus sp. 1XD8-22]|nr:acetyl-CoA carboxylase biotin carboxyl carrier protein [Butyricicoccus sp. 1XD8-22]
MQDIKQTVIELMDAAAARGLAEFELEVDDFKLKLKMGGSAAAVPASVPVVAAVPVAAAPAVSAAPAAAPTAPASAPAPAAQGVPEGRTVEAPLVGIFYAAPAPEEPPFIEVGQTVKKGDTLFIIEAMKTMNEIAAPCDGRISHILAQSGDMVEYGQVVVVMEEES